jgi:hypothetical protein
MATKSRKTASKKSPSKATRAQRKKSPAIVTDTKKSLKSRPAQNIEISEAATTREFNKLPSAWKLAKTAANTFWQHKRIFFYITLIYGLLNLILVQGLASSSDVGNLKGDLDKLFSGNISSLGSSLSVFAVLVGSAGNGSSQTAGAYQLFLALMTSLAVIWTLRQLFLGAKLRVRDAYYHGMYPLVPFMIVLIIIGIQLVPLLVGSAIYTTVLNNGIAVNLIEKIIWALVFAALAFVSLYLISSSLFGLYIVTLPDMTPLKSLRSARQLVRRRRLMVLRKILFLPLILLVASVIVMVPIIIWLTALAQWVFFVLTMLALVLAHAYLYTFYRELLNE